MASSTITRTADLVEYEIAAEVEGLADAAILTAAIEAKPATVPARSQRPGTVRGWSFQGSVD